MREGRLVVHTFESTGETIVVPPVSFASILKNVRRDHPEPKPPVIRVDYGDGDIRTELNYNDPNYPKAYALWDEFLRMEVTNRALNRIAAKQRLNEDQVRQVADLREELAGLEELHPNDKMVWFFDIALGTDEEIKEVIRKALRQAEPTKELIDEKSSSFPSEVQGNRHISVSHSS